MKAQDDIANECQKQNLNQGSLPLKSEIDLLKYL